MYLATASGGGDSARELAPPGQFHRRQTPESEIEQNLSESGTHTRCPTIEKGSEMSVPVVPRSEANDTASVVPTPLASRGDKPLSDFDEREWNHRNLIGWLDEWSARLDLPITDKLPTTFTSPDLDEDGLRAFAAGEIRLYAAAMLLDAAGGLDGAMQALLDVHRGDV
jgi:hypothetical protein